MDEIEITLTQNASGQPVYGYVLPDRQVLYNPNYSTCGRFKVDAFKEYGLFDRQVIALHTLNDSFNFNDEV
jgi:hypothetical protein